MVSEWRNELTHWGRLTHICVSKLTTIGSDNGLSPGRRQAIIWTNAGILLIGTLEINLSEILSEIHTSSFKKMHLKISSGRWRPFCFGLNELTLVIFTYPPFPDTKGHHSIPTDRARAKYNTKVPVWQWDSQENDNDCLLHPWCRPGKIREQGKDVG